MPLSDLMNKSRLPYWKAMNFRAECKKGHWQKMERWFAKFSETIKTIQAIIRKKGAERKNLGFGYSIKLITIFYLTHVDQYDADTREIKQISSFPKAHYRMDQIRPNIATENSFMHAPLFGRFLANVLDEEALL